MDPSLPITLNYKTKKSFPLIRAPYKKYLNAAWACDTVIKEALALKEIEKNFLDIISKKYGIVKRTLSYKMYLQKCGKNISEDLRGTHSKCFSDEEERTIATIIKNDFIDKQKPFDNESLKILAQDIYKRSYPEKNNFKVSIGWCTDFKKRWTFSSIIIQKQGFRIMMMIILIDSSWRNV